MQVNEREIFDLLESRANPASGEAQDVVGRALLKKGLSLEDVAILVNTKNPAEVEKIFEAAAKIKEEIYGERLVLFAPLYISDYCINNCAYCSFHTENEKLSRRQLTFEEIADETKCLIDMGHKRVLIEFGEDPDRNPIDYVCEAIRTIYKVRSGNGNIRRVNVNIAATSVENYKRLKAEDIGTYQLFQETYHRETYEKVHRGPKGNYDRQLTAHERAFEAGLDDLGIGVLFGLYDWRFEVLALIQHANYMDKTLGVGPHTISVPRFRKGNGINYSPEYPVSDEDFLKLIAILRLAVPYTGMILSTRESPEIRTKGFKLGISQASAASVTTPGGYKKLTGDRRPETGDGQFDIQDHRSVDAVIKSVIKDGMIPSFCTACYRSGRTGHNFMDLAKPGDIHNFCRPNAILTFTEYLEDYADAKTKKDGYLLVDKHLAEIKSDKLKLETENRINDIKNGKRDLFF